MDVNFKKTELGCRGWQRAKGPLWKLSSSPSGIFPPGTELLQTVSSLHSGRSLAWDHVRDDIDDSCGAIADPGGAFTIGGRRCGDGVRCATR